jgi:predicted secreted Zn-dependent protease
MEDATKIYQHICAILEKHEKDGQMSIIIRKEETNEFERNTLALKATSICMVLSGMAKLGISEKTILKHLLRSGVKPNIPAFSVNGLVSLLISL